MRVGAALAWLFWYLGPVNSQDRLRRCHVPEITRSAMRGTTLTPSIMQEILAASGAAVIRRLSSDAPSSMEYRDDRVNVQVDEAEKIVSIRCG